MNPADVQTADEDESSGVTDHLNHTNEKWTPVDHIYDPGPHLLGGPTQPLVSAQNNDNYNGDEANVSGRGCRTGEKVVLLLRTASVMLLCFCMGLSAGSISPGTADLMEIYGCNIEVFSNITTMRYIGMIAGSFLGGYLVNRFRQQSDLVLAWMTLLLAASNACIPWCLYVYVAGANFLVLGLVNGVGNVVGNTVTLAEWGENAAAPINALHITYVVGTLVAPPSLIPFLSNTTRGGARIKHIGSPSFYQFDAVPYENFSGVESNSTEPTRIYIPISIHSGLTLLVGVVFLVFYFLGWEYKSVSHQRGRSGGNSEASSLKFRIGMGVSVFVIYFCMVNRNLNAFVFITAVESSVKIPKTRAAVLNTVYNATWVVGRLIATGLAVCVKIHYIVFFGLISVVINSLCLTFFGLESEVTFWVLLCSMGVLSSPCYASVMAWADRYVEMEGKLMAVLDIGVGAGGVFSNVIGGMIFHRFGVENLFLKSAVASAVLLLLVSLVQIVCCKKGDRYEGNNTPEGDVLIRSDQNDDQTVVN